MGTRYVIVGIERTRLRWSVDASEGVTPEKALELTLASDVGWKEEALGISELEVQDEDGNTLYRKET